MTNRSIRSPLSPDALVDEYFIENRNRVIEIAAFLDRLDRANPGVQSDFRVQALREAIEMLTTSSTSRVQQIQILLSDPRTDPLPALDRKGAVGAFDKRAADL